MEHKEIRETRRLTALGVLLADSARELEIMIKGVASTARTLVSETIFAYTLCEAEWYSCVADLLKTRHRKGEVDVRFVINRVGETYPSNVQAKPN